MRRPRLYRAHRRVSVFKEVTQTPSKYNGCHFPVNLTEEKEKFFSTGSTPQFQLKEPSESLEKLGSKKRSRISTELLSEAKYVIDTVRAEFGDQSDYMAAAYGRQIDHIRGTKILASYLADSGCVGQVTVYWTPDLTSM